jgi:genome maintenance exonuclease 1
MKSHVTRRDGRDGRFYSVNGRLFPSVTTILQAIAKPALVKWSANVERQHVVDAAADLYTEWCAQVVPPVMPRSWYLTTLTARLGTKAHEQQLADAGDLGSATHKLVEWTLRTAIGAEAGPKPVVGDKSLWAWMSFDDWAKSVQLKPLLTERTVYSTVHGYAGTMDLLARVNGIVTTIEIKTSKAIYPEALLQASAYRVAMEEMGYAPQQSLIVRLPKNESDPAFEVLTVPPTTDLFLVFLAVKQLWHWTARNEAAYRARQRAKAKIA